MRFLVTAADTDGELLRIETTNPPTGVAEPLHVHPKQETRAELVSGTPHQFCNEGDEDAVAIQEARPALRTQQFFEMYFGLADRGELDQHGRPSLLRSATLGPAFADEIRVVSPPWPIQRVAYALLAPIARLRGYT
jgi:hypothetical protein